MAIFLSETGLVIKSFLYFCAIFLKNIREEREESSNLVKLAITVIMAILCAVIVCVILVENNLISKQSLSNKVDNVIAYAAILYINTNFIFILAIVAVIQPSKAISNTSNNIFSNATLPS